MREARVKVKIVIESDRCTIVPVGPMRLEGREGVRILTPASFRGDHDGKEIELTARFYDLDREAPPVFTDEETRAAFLDVARQLREPIDLEQPFTLGELEAYMLRFAAGIFLRADAGDGKGPRRFSLAALDRQHPDLAESFRAQFREWFAQSGRYPVRVTAPEAWEH